MSYRSDSSYGHLLSFNSSPGTLHCSVLKMEVSTRSYNRTCGGGGGEGAALPGGRPGVEEGTVQ